MQSPKRRTSPIQFDCDHPGRGPLKWDFRVENPEECYEKSWHSSFSSRFSRGSFPSWCKLAKSRVCTRPLFRPLRARSGRCKKRFIRPSDRAVVGPFYVERKVCLLTGWLVRVSSGFCGLRTAESTSSGYAEGRILASHKGERATSARHTVVHFKLGYSARKV